jgi:trehalose-6-phosphate synthase
MILYGCSSYMPLTCDVRTHQPKDGPGVLILSEFAGSAQSLSGAIRVNPWNTDQLAGAIKQVRNENAHAHLSQCH